MLFKQIIEVTNLKKEEKETISTIEKYHADLEARISHHYKGGREEGIEVDMVNDI